MEVTQDFAIQRLHAKRFGLPSPNIQRLHARRFDEHDIGLTRGTTEQKQGRPAAHRSAEFKPHAGKVDSNMEGDLEDDDQEVERLNSDLEARIERVRAENDGLHQHNMILRSHVAGLVNKAEYR
jgi:hypothetical protein